MLEDHQKVPHCWSGSNSGYCICYNNRACKIEIKAWASWIHSETPGKSLFQASFGCICCFFLFTPPSLWMGLKCHSKSTPVSGFWPILNLISVALFLGRPNCQFELNLRYRGLGLPQRNFWGAIIQHIACNLEIVIVYQDFSSDLEIRENVLLLPPRTNKTEFLSLKQLLFLAGAPR